MSNNIRILSKPIFVIYIFLRIKKGKRSGEQCFDNCPYHNILMLKNYDLVLTALHAEKYLLVLNVPTSTTPLLTISS